MSRTKMNTGNTKHCRTCFSLALELFCSYNQKLKLAKLHFAPFEQSGGRPLFTGDTWDAAWKAESTLSLSLLDSSHNARLWKHWCAHTETRLTLLSQKIREEKRSYGEVNLQTRTTDKLPNKGCALYQAELDFVNHEQHRLKAAVS